MKAQEKEILQVYKNYWTTYFSRGKGVKEKIFSNFHPDANGIGTGKDEIVKSSEELRKFIDREFAEVTETLPVNFIWSDVSVYNSVAVGNGEIEIILNPEKNLRMSVRNSLVFKKHSGNWKVVHLHVSLPAAGQAEDESFPLDALKAQKEKLEREVAEKTTDLRKKNRELKIEAALEKVRSIAMAMKEPADMLEVCRHISLQLASLGVKEIRNVQTAIFYKQRGTYMNYEYYAKHKKTLITETTYSNNQVHQEFASKMMKGKGEFFITHIKDDDVKEWIAYQKTTNVFIDKHLETASSLSYYWFSLGPVALGISTYHTLSEEETKLFKQFLKVFELAYQRYLDIEKAQAQAREAQIELALERVRARTMAMQKSTELKEIIQVVYEQFVHLKIHIEHTGFIMDYKARDDMHIWLADQNGAPSQVTIPYFNSPHWNSFNDAKAKGMDFFANQLNFEEKNSFYKKLFKHIPGLPEDAKDFYLNCPGLAISTVLLENVGLYIENFSGTPYSDGENNTLLRFGKVFQQTYTRFLDLQKAEAQAHEAEIETSLERVRGRAMAMHNSEDLALTVDVFFKELKSLKVTPRRCGVTLINEKSRVADLTVTTAKNKGSDLKLTAKLKLAGHPVLDKVYKSWKQQNEYHPVLQGEEIKKYYQVMNPQVSYPDFPDDVIQYGHYFFFEEGGVFAWTDKELSNNDLNIFRRFTTVLSLTYRRYIDLKNAEAQNKIIQAENERKTNELEEARQLQIAMLPKELPKLPYLDIAVYMKTATEVGGDYYDFCFSENGSLNICLGDATGHGMKAGIMVSSMKSIFTTNASKMDIENFFTTANNGVKSMKLQRMMMGFAMININQHKLKFINAGMPPVLLYHKKTKTIEEIKEHGLPVGAMSHSSYKVVNGSLQKGDVLLLMSDGMPELHNSENEMFGYQRIQDCFKQVTEKEPEHIVGHLKNSAANWAGNKDPDDDVTFVVIKLK